MSKLAWVPRRAGERGALETGCLPTLLPGGRPVEDAAARVDLGTVWGTSVPAKAGRDGDAIIAGVASGEVTALVVGGVDPLDLPDPADRHVLETALAGGADRIVTANLRDFPRPALAPLGLRATDPDEFLRDLFLRHPGPVLAAVEATEARARHAGAAIPRKELMRRARLPRLAKAIARSDMEKGQG